MNSYFDPVTLEKMLRENGYLSGSKQKYTRENTVYQYTEEDFKTRLAQGTAADKTIFNFIRSGKADAFLMEKLGYHLKYKANQIFANMDIMSKEVNDMAEVSSLYETAGAGMTQVYMKNFVSSLWIIRCVVDKQKPDEILFDGLKSLVKRKEGDDYIFDLMRRIFPQKGKTKSTTKPTRESVQPDKGKNDAIEELRQRVGKVEQSVETLKEDNKVHNDFLHSVAGFAKNADTKIENNHAMDDAIPLLSSNYFMKVMQKAEKMGFVQYSCNSHFKWLKTKKELAVFAQVGSERMNLSNRHNSDGTPQTNWQPFEVLFNENGLAGTYNGMKNKGDEWPKNIKEIKELYDV